MEGATVALLVTWIMPGGADQPNIINSYQSQLQNCVGAVNYWDLRADF
jgi:hypothetical protein